LSTKSYFPTTVESSQIRQSSRRKNSRDKEKTICSPLAQKTRRASEPSLFLVNKEHLSSWSRSGAKRVFDCSCVLAIMPLLIPILVAVWLAVRVTSQGPVFFLQKRVGRHGNEFTIFKFRTMIHDSDKAHHPVTTSGNQLFTPIGPFLRRWKLDELPQLFNVLTGEMSLVGPRPKLPQHAISHLSCRAGITGAATIAFACEEAILDRVPKHHLQSFYHCAVLPAKHRIDADYMANATFLSDLKLIVDSVLRRWDTSVMERLLTSWAFELGSRPHIAAVSDTDTSFAHSTILPHMNRPASTGEARAV
jgi:lipopolysaccharide/colanic/teichoic acid biosynthesis glycosyltransferase